MFEFENVEKVKFTKNSVTVSCELVDYTPINFSCDKILLDDYDDPLSRNHISLLLFVQENNIKNKDISIFDVYSRYKIEFDDENSAQKYILTDCELNKIHITRYAGLVEFKFNFTYGKMGFTQTDTSVAANCLLDILEKTNVTRLALDFKERGDLSSGVIAKLSKNNNAIVIVNSRDDALHFKKLFSQVEYDRYVVPITQLEDKCVGRIFDYVFVYRQSQFKIEDIHTIDKITDRRPAKTQYVYLD